MGEQSEMLVGQVRESAPVYLAMQSFTLSSVCHPVPNFALRRVLALVSDAGCHHDRHYEIENPTSAWRWWDLLRSSADFNAVRVRDGADVIACGVNRPSKSD